MKRRLLPLLFSLLLLLSACGGRVAADFGSDFGSTLYSDEEILAAMEVTKQYFKQNFDDCTLTDLSYGGDEKSRDYAEWADRHDADEVIVLLSSFDVGDNAHDSLNPNDTYTNWMWILVRNSGGLWRHVDHGY